MGALPKKAIQGPGLKKQGIVVLQIIFIGFFVLIEMTIRTGVGVLTGVAICLALFGSLRLGRPGTSYVAVVTPPLAFAGSAALITLFLDGFSPSRVGIDVITALASEAPFLIISTLVGWFVYLNQRAKARPSKARRDQI